jgi:hypothetical protein
MKNPALKQRLAREFRLAVRVDELRRMAGVSARPEVQRLARDIQVRARVLGLKRRAYSERGNDF